MFAFNVYNPVLRKVLCDTSKEAATGVQACHDTIREIMHLVMPLLQRLIMQESLLDAQLCDGAKTVLDLANELGITLDQNPVQREMLPYLASRVSTVGHTPAYTDQQGSETMMLPDLQPPQQQPVPFPVLPLPPIDPPAPARVQIEQVTFAKPRKPRKPRATKREMIMRKAIANAQTTTPPRSRFPKTQGSVTEIIATPEPQASQAEKPAPCPDSGVVVTPPPGFNMSDYDITKLFGHHSLELSGKDNPKNAPGYYDELRKQSKKKKS